MILDLAVFQVLNPAPPFCRRRVSLNIRANYQVVVAAREWQILYYYLLCRLLLYQDHVNETMASKSPGGAAVYLSCDGAPMDDSTLGHAPRYTGTSTCSANICMLLSELQNTAQAVRVLIGAFSPMCRLSSGVRPRIVWCSKQSYHTHRIFVATHLPGSSWTSSVEILALYCRLCLSPRPVPGSRCKYFVQTVRGPVRDRSAERIVGCPSYLVTSSEETKLTGYLAGPPGLPFCELADSAAVLQHRSVNHNTRPHAVRTRPAVKRRLSPRSSLSN